jgi:hypothetical protein
MNFQHKASVDESGFNVFAIAAAEEGAAVIPCAMGFDVVRMVVEEGGEGATPMEHA